MNILFLDTETTGLESGRLIQLAYKKRGESDIFVEYYKPPVPIEFEAMGVHHITEKMVSETLPFADTQTYRDMPAMLSDGILVAHNAKYDIGILKTEGIETGKFICTYKVAYRLYDLPNHKLQSLRYRWGFEIENATAHDAAGDVMVLEKVFEYMLRDYCQANAVSEEEAIWKFIEISSEPTLLRTVPLGKYRGMTFEEAMKTDLSYMTWMKDKMENKAEDLAFTLEHHFSKGKSEAREDVPF